MEARAQSEDPNSDLIGFEFQIEGKTWTVTKTPVWSEGNYVQIECEDGTLSCRPAGLVRQRMQGL